MRERATERARDKGREKCMLHDASYAAPLCSSFPKRVYVRVFMCSCVCLYVCVCVHISVCVCVRAWEREKKRENVCV